MPVAEAEKVYVSACTVVKAEFHQATTVKPRLTLVLGANTDRVYLDEHEVQLRKWNEHLFAQGVVVLAVEELLNPEERLRLGELAVRWAETTVGVEDLNTVRTKRSLVEQN